MAAASISQVHLAVTPEGEAVAVKVQRPNIRKYAKWDLWSFRILLKLYERIFELPLSFSGQYISDQIEQETFFQRELANSLRAKHAIETDPEAVVRKTCYVPKFYEDMCTQRVLVMEWIGGTCRMTDREKLDEMGLSAKQVSRSVCEAFASQIFQHGFTTKPGGHGFGLHASANAARELGGRLTATSDGVDRGAAFTLWLPLDVGGRAHAARN